MPFLTRCHRYGLLLFPGFGDGTKELDYNTVNTYVKGAFVKMGFTNSRKVRSAAKTPRASLMQASHLAQVMHFWRYYAAWMKHSMYTPLDDIKHDGRWELSEFAGVYGYHLKPITSLVAAAGFDARYPERYHVPRTEVDAPPALLSLVRRRPLSGLHRLPQRFRRFGSTADAHTRTAGVALGRCLPRCGAGA